MSSIIVPLEIVHRQSNNPIAHRSTKIAWLQPNQRVLPLRAQHCRHRCLLIDSVYWGRRHGSSRVDGGVLGYACPELPELP